MTWIEPDQWYAQLPTVHVAARALIRDRAGRVLLVKASYRDGWDLPGGMVEAGEPPDRAAVREVREELGLDLGVRRLVVLDWQPPRGARPRPLFACLYDLGVDADPKVVLQRSELDGWRFAALADLDGLMPGWTAARVRAAVDAADAGTTVYLVDGVAGG